MAQAHDHSEEPTLSLPITLGFFADIVYVGGGEDIVSAAETVDLRSAGLEIGGVLPEVGRLYALVSFEGEETALEEAELTADRLPAGLEVRAGRFLADFGRWNRLHLHDKPYVFEDGVRQTMFGGNLSFDGVELGQRLGDRIDSPRWSLGLGTSFSGHEEGALDSAGSHAHGFEQIDEDISPAQWGYTGRVSAGAAFGEADLLQWGLSAFHTPEGYASSSDLDGDGIPDTEAGLAQTTFALDLTLLLEDHSSGGGQTASVELWLTDREVLVEGSSVVADREATGVWGYFQHDFNPNWSVGTMAAWWQDPSHAIDAELFTGTEAGAMRAAYVTWNLSPENRLRLQLTQFAPVELDSAWAIALQWDVILGHHAHPDDHERRLDWAE